MNLHSKPRPLFFTPRSPWGRLPLKQAHHSHMRASEGDRDLPEDDKPGLITGNLEVSGGAQGKPEFSGTVGVHLNSKAGETANQKDPFWQNRTVYDPDRAEFDKRRALEHEQKNAQAAQAKKAAQAADQRAQAAQQPKKPSRWKFKSIPASEQKLPGAY